MEWIECRTDSQREDPAKVYEQEVEFVAGQLTAVEDVVAGVPTLPSLFPALRLTINLVPCQFGLAVNRGQNDIFDCALAVCPHSQVARL